MKKSMILLFIFFAFITYENNPVNPKPYDKATILERYWSLVYRTGGIAGVTIWQPKDSRDILYFNSTSFSHYINDKLTDSSEYWINKQKSIYSSELIDFINLLFKLGK